MTAMYRVEPSGCFLIRMYDIGTSEATRYSCRLYVASASRKLPGIRRNLAATRMTESTVKLGISSEKQSTLLDRRVSVAPMMDWTDRHCRYFLRGFSRHALLYTEMITAAAILRGDRGRRVALDPRDHPGALQLGRGEPRDAGAAA